MWARQDRCCGSCVRLRRRWPFARNHLARLSGETCSQCPRGTLGRNWNSGEPSTALVSASDCTPPTCPQDPTLCFAERGSWCSLTAVSGTIVPVTASCRETIVLGGGTSCLETGPAIVETQEYSPRVGGSSFGCGSTRRWCRRPVKYSGLSASVYFVFESARSRPD